MKLPNDVRRLLTWISQLGLWLWQMKVGFLCFLPVGGSYAYLRYITHWCEPSIRFVGLVFQLAGLGLVVWEAVSTRRKFGHPSTVSRIKRHFANFPKWPGTVTISLSASLEGVKAYATANLLTSLPDNATLEDRIARLETQLNVLETKTASTITEFQQRFQSHDEKFDLEAANRTNAVTLLHLQLEETATGGLDLSQCGVVWLFFGAVFSTISPEIAQEVVNWCH